MNYSVIRRNLAFVLWIYAALMLLPAFVGLLYWERNALCFAETALLTAAVAYLIFPGKGKGGSTNAKDGFVTVAAAWILMTIFGALPLRCGGDFPTMIDAMFETASGLTTTGASVCTDVEGMSRCGLFWRMFTHWIGGMGVIVFMLAVLPMDGAHSMHIMRAEVPGPTVGKLVPRVRRTAKILYLIYGGMTVVETIFLLFGGMNFYDALLHAFATAGTGGFSTRAASIGAYNSVYIEVVIGIFMILFGVNFNLYYLILIGRVKDALHSEELRTFLIIIAVAVLAIAAGITAMYGSFAAALRHAFFNVASVISTTGFGTVDFTLWPQYCQWILIFLMFCGGCAGSTGGGMKVSRLMILARHSVADIRKMARPRSVQCVRLDGRRVDDDTLKAASAFAHWYFAILIAAAALISFDGYDIATCFTASLACLSNIGPGMGLVGPMGSYAIFSGFSKVVLTIVMLMGRLELFPILILFSPSTWKK